jgi:hypothetical protein
MSEARYRADRMRRRMGRAPSGLLGNEGRRGLGHWEVRALSRVSAYARSRLGTGVSRDRPDSSPSMPKIAGRLLHFTSCCFPLLSPTLQAGLEAKTVLKDRSKLLISLSERPETYNDKTAATDRVMIISVRQGSRTMSSSSSNAPLRFGTRAGKRERTES